jgi:hypothetical protein
MSFNWNSIVPENWANASSVWNIIQGDLIPCYDRFRQQRCYCLHGLWSWCRRSGNLYFNPRLYDYAPRQLSAFVRRIPSGCLMGQWAQSLAKALRNMKLFSDRTHMKQIIHQSELASSPGVLHADRRRFFASNQIAHVATWNL